MSDLPVLKGVLALLVCQLVGEVTARLLGLEVPGPVLGMVVFLVVLRLSRPRPTSGLVRGPTLLLDHLQLLFVPAGVGVIVYLEELRSHWLPLAAGLLVSWLVGLVVTGGVVAGSARFLDRRRR